jgi:transcriptional regulator with XRE-family HTH domain
VSHSKFISVGVLLPQCHARICVVTTQDDEWTKGLHQRIAEAIKDARQGRLTGQQLADDTEQLGYPITRSQIANYESGRKQSLDVAELLVLAAALGVPPVALLFPNLPDGDVEVVPGQVMSSADAMRWFTGENDSSEPQSDLGRLITLTRKRFDMERKRDRYRAGVDMLLAMDEEQRATNAILDLADAAEEIEELNRQIATVPGAVIAGIEGEGTR